MATANGNLRPSGAIANAAKAEWRVGWLLLGIAFAALLLGSWQLPATRSLWDALDRSVYGALHETLAWGPQWQHFWALANHRGFDAAVAGVFLALLLHHALQASGQERLARLCATSFIAFWSLLTLDVLARWLEVERLSPSLAPVLSGDVRSPRLSELVPDVTFKDASTQSFPGDHGTVLVVLSAMTWHLVGRRLGIVFALASCVLVLPRLVSGAHWATDVLVGSFACAAVSLGIALATPVRHFGVDLPCALLAALVLRRDRRSQANG